MFRSRITAVARIARDTRSFTTARVLCQTPPHAPEDSPLPSSKDMKNQWDIEQDTVTSRVMKMTNLLHQQAEPPLDIDDLFTKKFRPLENYDPFDLSMDKVDIDARLRKHPKNLKSRDPFERAGIDPLDLYTMPVVLSRFLTSLGQILPREITGCNSRNQKKLAIAVKRARSCGLLSYVHRDVTFVASRNM